MGYDLNLKI